jgi:hypothetical protein
MRTSQNICAYRNVCFQSKYMRTSWNICTNPKYLPSKIFTPHLNYLCISKIYAPQLKCLRLIIYDSNKAAVEISAPYEKYMRPENRRSNSYYLGSAESPSSDFWLLSLAEELSFRWCCLSSLQSSSAMPMPSPGFYTGLWPIRSRHCRGRGIPERGGRCEGGSVGGGGREGGRRALIQVKEGGRGEGWVTITTRVQGVWACTSPLHQDSSWPPS